VSWKEGKDGHFPFSRKEKEGFMASSLWHKSLLFHYFLPTARMKSTCFIRPVNTTFDYYDDESPSPSLSPSPSPTNTILFDDNGENYMHTANMEAPRIRRSKYFRGPQKMLPLHALDETSPKQNLFGSLPANVEGLKQANKSGKRRLSCCLLLVRSPNGLTYHCFRFSRLVPFPPPPPARRSSELNGSTPAGENKCTAVLPEAATPPTKPKAKQHRLQSYHYMKNKENRKRSFLFSSPKRSQCIRF
jgi:hypothetical protein